MISIEGLFYTLQMRFGIVNRTVSYIGLRQISSDVTLLAKAPLGKGPRPPPASWKAQATTKKDLDREIKNRHQKPEEKRQKITKYIVAVCALGAIIYIIYNIYFATILGAKCWSSK